MSHSGPVARDRSPASKLIIRRATEHDIRAIQYMARETWADTYRGIIPAEAQDRILSTAYSDHALAASIRRGQAFLVAEETGLVRNSGGPADADPKTEETEIVRTGGCSTYLELKTGGDSLPPSSRAVGYVDVDFDGTKFNLHRLYVLPGSQRSGLGRRLLSEAVRALAPGFIPPNERWVDSQAAGPIQLEASLPPIPPGSYRLFAHVERDNPKARAFYSRMGFSEDKEENVSIGGISLPLVSISVTIEVRSHKEVTRPRG